MISSETPTHGSENVYLPYENIYLLCQVAGVVDTTRPVWFPLLSSTLTMELL